MYGMFYILRSEFMSALPNNIIFNVWTVFAFKNVIYFTIALRGETRGMAGSQPPKMIFFLGSLKF